jgi:Putative Actinobacterial Holin-X, holin superfamily III
MANDVQSPSGPSDPIRVNGDVAADVRVVPEQNTATLLSGIIADVQHLIRQQLAMFRQEIRDDVRKGRKAVLPLAAGAGITAAGGVLLLLMLPLLLHWAVPELPLWACFGILGGVLAAVGGALVYAGVRRIESLDLLSNPAVEAFKENLTWTTKPT